MIKKLLLKENSKTQLAAAFAGTLVGFILLLAAYQMYDNFSAVFKKNDELIRPEYIIINKELAMIGSTPEFKDSEIELIKEQPFVTSVAPFVKNEFEVTGSTRRDSKIAYLSTQLFFEAVPDEYLDVKHKLWDWKPGDTIVPVIVPKDYLNLYNFGFSQAEGLPQVVPSMISLITFDLKIYGYDGIHMTKSKIVGFSDRINSILVPYGFLTYANKTYHKGKKSRPTRMLIVSNDPSDPKLLEFLQKNDFETNKEKLKNTKLKFLLQIILAIIAVAAFIIISLAFFVFILGFQLMITKSKEKLRTLLYLGYDYMSLSRQYFIFFTIIVAAINIISFIMLTIINNNITSYLMKNGFEIDSGLSIETILIGLGISILIIALNTAFIIRQVKKIGRNEI